jgi:transposase-like protein
MLGYRNPRIICKYTNEFKAVQLGLIEGIQVKSFSETLEIHPMMLSRWSKKYVKGKIVQTVDSSLIMNVLLKHHFTLD